MFINLELKNNIINYENMEEKVIEKIYEFNLQDIHENGLSINAYTVNEEAHMKRLVNLGIDGIITNFPDILKKIE